MSAQDMKTPPGFFYDPSLPMPLDYQLIAFERQKAAEEKQKDDRKSPKSKRIRSGEPVVMSAQDMKTPPGFVYDPSLPMSLDYQLIAFERQKAAEEKRKDDRKSPKSKRIRSVEPDMMRHKTTPSPPNPFKRIVPPGIIPSDHMIHGRNMSIKQEPVARPGRPPSKGNHSSKQLQQTKKITSRNKNDIMSIKKEPPDTVTQWPSSHQSFLPMPGLPPPLVLNLPPGVTMTSPTPGQPSATPLVQGVHVLHPPNWPPPPHVGAIQSANNKSNKHDTQQHRGDLRKNDFMLIKKEPPDTATQWPSSHQSFLPMPGLPPPLGLNLPPGVTVTSPTPGQPSAIPLVHGVYVLHPPNWPPPPHVGAIQSSNNNSNKHDTQQHRGDLQIHPGGNQETTGRESYTDEFSHFPKLFERPTRHEVLTQLAPIDTLWYSIGIGLGVSYNDLQGLAEANLSNQTTLDRVIQRWFEMNGEDGGAPVTWTTILDVIKEPLFAHKALAMKIYEYLKQQSAISHKDSEHVEETNEQSVISDFPVVDQQHFREALNKSGTVKTRISKAIVQGPARTGKTSVKSLILSQPYKSEVSTGCCESPDIAVGEFAVSRYGRQDEYHWELVDSEAMIEKFTSEIRDLMSQQKKENNVESSHNSKEIKELPVDDQTSYTADTPDDDLKPLSSSKLSHPAKESVAAARVGEMELIHMVNKAQGKHGKLTLHKEWLYFIDCGGQIQFQQLVQAFIPCASVLILVTSLAENLSNKCSASFQYEEDKFCDVSDYLPSIETLLRHLTLMVSSSSLQQELVEGNELSDKIKIPEKLKVLVIATHHDIYEERLRNGEQIENIDEKEETFKQIFMHIEDNLVFLDGKIFFEVDGRKASQKVFDDPAIVEIRAELRDQAFEVDIPLSWYAFEILLRERASTPKDCGVLSLKDCETIGFSLGLKKEEVQSALKFFHLLNTILYYPGVSDLVFINPHCLIEVIHELVVFVCERRRRVKSGRGTAECRKVVEQGKISKDVLNTISKKCLQISKLFPDHDFSSLLLRIFKHLLIATERPSKKFFMPALLPLTDPSQSIPSSHFSLLLYFKKGAPLGLFCAMIVNLLLLRVDSSDDFCDDFVWSIDRTSIMFSNLITLQHYDMKGKVVFIESNNCFEVHFKYIEDKEKGENVIHSTLKDTIKKRNFDSSKIKYKKASFCPCPKQPCHAAILHACGKLRCMISGDLIEDPDKQSDIASSKVMTSPSTRPQISTKREEYTGFQDVGSMGKERESTSLEVLLDQQPDLKELTTHARTAKWNLLGVQLELDSIDLDGCADLTSMYRLWIQEKAGLATRRNLLTALQSIRENDVAWKYKNYLRTLIH